jgi:Putative Ig domain
MSTKVSVLLVSLLVSTIFCGCNNQPMTLTISPKPQTLAAGSQTTFTALIKNGSGTQVGWYVVPSAGSGSLSPGTSTNSTTYTAPVTAPSPNSITLTAYSIAYKNTLDTITFTIIGSALPSIQTTPLPTGTVGLAYPSTPLQATGGAPPYTWALNSGILPAGMNFTNGTISGTPGSAGSFPLTVQVTDSQNNSSTSTLTLTVSFPVTGTCGSPVGNESVLNGQYAFLLQGFDSNGPAAIAGSFTTDGMGNVTGGQLDQSTNNGFSPKNLTFTTSSNYTVDSTNRGCLALATSSGTFVYRLSAIVGNSGGASQGFIIAFDSSGVRVEGTFQKQDPSAFSSTQIAGNYAFGVASSLPKYQRYAAVGSFTASGGSITGVMDNNNTGNVDYAGAPVVGVPPTYPATPLTFTGTYSIAANGRGTVTFNLANVTIDGLVYVVSAGQLYFMSADAEPTPLFAGQLLQQTGAPFSATSLSENSVRYFGGLSSAGKGSREELAVLTISTPGSFAYNSDYNDGGLLNNASQSGSYTVDPNSGRINLSADLLDTPVCYVSAPNTAFCMSTDKLVSFGEILPQTAGPFSNTSITGTFGFGTVQEPSVNGNLQSGNVEVASAGNLNTVTDDNGAGSILTLGTQGSSEYVINADGTGTLQPSAGLGNSIIYLVSPQLWLAIESYIGATDPTLTVYTQ